MLVISSPLHLMMMRLNVSAFHLKVTFTAQIQIFKHLMPILSREGKIGPKVQTQRRNSAVKTALLLIHKIN